ncbi:Cation efflux protein [Sesbania bispinosa]|nr:Cation efflux protein [Sesbania bispinosa]
MCLWLDNLHGGSTWMNIIYQKGTWSLILALDLPKCTEHRKLAEYYKRQERLLKGYQEVDSYTDLGMIPGNLTEDEMKQLERSEKVAIYASNIGNMVLFVAKVYASIESRSLAVIASTLDSLLDLLSGFILWFTAYAMSKPNHYKYPIGKNRMQPVAQPERDPVKEKWMIGIMVTATLIALYTISNWSKTVMENVWSLIGKTAPPEYLAKITYLCWNHDKEIKHIDTVRAYTFGSYYFVEVDIVVSEEMSLNQAHDIGEALQDKLEKLPEIERAFVHVDLNTTHKLEHKQLKVA